MTIRDTSPEEISFNDCIIKQKIENWIKEINDDLSNYKSNPDLKKDIVLKITLKNAFPLEVNSSYPSGKSDAKFAYDYKQIELEL